MTQVFNQKQLLKNIIDNVERGAYVFRDGKNKFESWKAIVEAYSDDFDMNIQLLDEADKQMVESKKAKISG
jgi:hypothetical protein